MDMDDDALENLQRSDYYDIPDVAQCRFCGHIAYGSEFQAGIDPADPMLMMRRFRCPQCRQTKYGTWRDLVKIPLTQDEAREIN